MGEIYLVEVLTNECHWIGLMIDKSTLVQVMAWSHQAISHYLNQYWPRSPMPYGITRPQIKVCSSPMPCTVQLHQWSWIMFIIQVLCSAIKTLYMPNITHVPCSAIRPQQAIWYHHVLCSVVRLQEAIEHHTCSTSMECNKATVGYDRMHPISHTYK